MAEKKLAAVGADMDTEKTSADTQMELQAQVAELRAEIVRLTETVSAIGSGAKASYRGRRN